MRFGKIALAVAGVSAAGALAVGVFAISDGSTSAVKDNDISVAPPYNRFVFTEPSPEVCQDGAGAYNQPGNYAQESSPGFYYCSGSNLWERMN